ncbi:G2/mitotic-specific cyclin [Microbotryomycetes sp. JL201]|nr:G2/mitotic-specific cyclin [Microbotryomycetes sp. JL201]
MTSLTQLSASGTGAENDLSGQPQAGTSAIEPARKPQLVVQARPRTALGAKGTNQAKTSATAIPSLAVSRARSALGDVTNGSKTRGTAATGTSKSVATNSQPPATEEPVLSNPSSGVRRVYRTRASLGAVSSADKVKAESSEPVLPPDADDNAMAIDEDDLHDSRPISVAVPIARPVRNLKRTSTAVSVSGSGGGPAAMAATRRPLGQKSANTGTIVRQEDVKEKVSKATLAMRARRRREEAEQRQREAERELELARREEEELAGHRSKKARTSEPDHDDLNVATYEAEVEEREHALARRPKDYGWEDLDEGDEDDPMMVSAYVVEVYEYLRELELTTMPDPDYMSNQGEVNWKMRGILIDWLIEIHTKFRLLPETIFLATNIIDRFLSKRDVSLTKFQLVGITALFIAAKYEEVVCPSVSNFLYMTDGGYTDDEILRAERYVLGMIDFNLSYPNPIHFLRRISKADDYDIQSRTMAKYLMEMSIVDHRFMATPPSLIAAAGSWLARKVLDRGEWDANLVHYSGYSEEEIKPTAQMMLDYVVRTSPNLTKCFQDKSVKTNPLRAFPQAEHEVEHPNFVKKYAAKKFFKASTSIRLWAEDTYGTSHSSRARSPSVTPAIL